MLKAPSVNSSAKQNLEESTTEAVALMHTLSEDAEGLAIAESDVVAQTDRRGSQGSRTILLKGEMKFLKDINMLIFLCSPL